MSVQERPVSPFFWLETGADVCGRIGCRRGGQLFEVTRPSGEKRVLCAEHAEAWSR